MSEFLINPNAGPCRYNLIAVSNHYGGMGGGHCECTRTDTHHHQYLFSVEYILNRIHLSELSDTAYAKNKDDDKWYNFDDSIVSAVSEDQIVVRESFFFLLPL